MHVLFVHGMGRTPISGLPLLWRLKREGHDVHTFAYSATLSDVSALTKKLCTELEKISGKGKYVVIGHSLGGVLLRNALQSIPEHVRKPCHLFLLGSPVKPASLALKKKQNPMFRFLTQDCGNLLMSEKRLALIGMPDVDTTIIAGTKDILVTKHHFSGEPNDGVVSLKEVLPNDYTYLHLVPVLHTWLPSHRNISSIILSRIKLL